MQKLAFAFVLCAALAATALADTPPPAAEVGCPNGLCPPAAVVQSNCAGAVQHSAVGCAGAQRIELFRRAPIRTFLANRRAIRASRIASRVHRSACGG